MASQNPGKVFEREFKESCNKRGYYYLRLKDSTQAWQRNSATKFTTNNPYDCLIFSDNTLFCFELKSTKATSLSFWSEKIEVTNIRAATESMIKKCQVQGLSEAAEHKGVVAGLVINFRETTNHTYFWHIKHFLKFIEKTTKKSFNEEDIILNSGILIPQELKRIKYDYFIDNIIDIFKDCKIKGE